MRRVPLDGTAGELSLSCKAAGCGSKRWTVGVCVGRTACVPDGRRVVERTAERRAASRFEKQWRAAFTPDLFPHAVTGAHLHQGRAPLRSLHCARLIQYVDPGAFPTWERRVQPPDSLQSGGFSLRRLLRPRFRRLPPGRLCKFIVAVLHIHPTVDNISQKFCKIRSCKFHFTVV